MIELPKGCYAYCHVIKNATSDPERVFNERKAVIQRLNKSDAWAGYVISVPLKEIINGMQIDTKAIIQLDDLREYVPRDRVLILDVIADRYGAKDIYDANYPREFVKHGWGYHKEKRTNLAWHDVGFARVFGERMANVVNYLRDCSEQWIGLTWGETSVKSLDQRKSQAGQLEAVSAYCDRTDAWLGMQTNFANDMESMINELEDYNQIFLNPPDVAYHRYTGELPPEAGFDAYKIGAYDYIANSSLVRGGQFQTTVLNPYEHREDINLAIDGLNMDRLFFWPQHFWSRDKRIKDEWNGNSEWWDWCTEFATGARDELIGEPEEPEMPIIEHPEETVEASAPAPELDDLIMVDVDTLQEVKDSITDLVDPLTRFMEAVKTLNEELAE